jgi:hypothetical protein
VKLVSLKRVMNPVFMIELCKWRFWLLISY